MLLKTLWDWVAFDSLDFLWVCQESILRDLVSHELHVVRMFLFVQHDVFLSTSTEESVEMSGRHLKSHFI